MPKAKALDSKKMPKAKALDSKKMPKAKAFLVNTPERGNKKNPFLYTILVVIVCVDF